VTASPAGTSLPAIGRLDLPTTTTLVGNEPLNDDWRGGWHVNAGLWLDDCQRWAVQGDFFDLGGDDNDNAVGASPDRAVARPFFNAQSGGQDAELVSVPGELGGTVTVSSDDDFRGAGLALRNMLWDCCQCDPCGATRQSQLYVLGGYRYYRYGSELRLAEDLVILPGTTQPLVPGTQIFVRDNFTTENEFHGGELGLGGRLGRGCWFVDGSALLAIGSNRRRVTIDGSTTNIVPGDGTSSFAGGLLTSPETNIGRYESSETAVIPRFRLAAGAQLTERLTASVGYNVIVWGDVLVASSQLPPGLATDPRNLPPVTSGGGPDPAFPTNADDQIVAHGFDFTLQYAY
jgi:hypothetical protein